MKMKKEQNILHITHNCSFESADSTVKNTSMSIQICSVWFCSVQFGAVIVGCTPLKTIQCKVEGSVRCNGYPALLQRG